LPGKIAARQTVIRVILFTFVILLLLFIL